MKSAVKLIVNLVLVVLLSGCPVPIPESESEPEPELGPTKFSITIKNRTSVTLEDVRWNGSDPVDMQPSDVKNIEGKASSNSSISFMYGGQLRITQESFPKDTEVTINEHTGLNDDTKFSDHINNIQPSILSSSAGPAGTNEVSITVTLADNGGKVTARGVVYSTSPNPTKEHEQVCYKGTGTEKFTCHLTNLSPSTMYYIRAFAVDDNSNTVYGSELEVTTLDEERKQIPISGSFYYNGINVTSNNSDYEYPRWSGASSGQTVNYSISPSWVSGVTIESSSGKVSVSSSADVMDRSFTITATGTGNYEGTKTATIDVEVIAFIVVTPIYKITKLQFQLIDPHEPSGDDKAELIVLVKEGNAGGKELLSFSDSMYKGNYSGWYDIPETQTPNFWIELTDEDVFFDDVVSGTTGALNYSPGEWNFEFGGGTGPKVKFYYSVKKVN